MKTIALTGGIGSGKSSALREFQKLGAEIIDSDKISHMLMMCGKAAYNEVVAEFGREVLGENGEIDRKKLAGIVFSDEKKLKRLNEITHKLIYKEIKRKIFESNADVVCIEIPLLFTGENPLDLDMKIAVVADRETRISRVTSRDGATREQAEARMNRQLSDDEMRRLADCVIENDGDIKALERRVREIYKSLTGSGAERRLV